MSDEKTTDASRDAASESAIDPIVNVETTELAATEATTPNAEGSATSEVAKEEAPKEALPPSAQERINQVNAEKWATRRENDRLKLEIDALKTQQVSTQPVQPPPQQPISGAAPRLEDFEYDESKHQAALTNHQASLVEAKIDAKFNERLAKEEASRTELERVQLQSQYDQGLVKFLGEQKMDMDSFVKNVQNLPKMPQSVEDAIMRDKDGPKLAYHLSKNLDSAYRIAGSDPVVAALELGKISAQLSATSGVAEVSNAPPPVNTISGSGSSVSNNDENMTADEMSRRIKAGEM